MSNRTRVVIVGAGQAGTAAVAALRENGFDGSITVVGAERHPPYQRPPLSKDYLRGETRRTAAYLQSEEFWAADDVTVMTGLSVEKIDRGAAQLMLSNGRTLTYDRLILAPGSDARHLRIPGAELDGVVTLRTFEDADRLRDLATGAGHILVIGGGWIGSEVAASLRRMGAAVTLTFAGDLLLEQALGPAVGRVYDQLHREHGVMVMPRTRITSLDGNGRVRGAQTDAGGRLEADLVVAAVGAQPRLQLAVEAGLTTSDGIIVDSLLQASDPTVLAAGDVAQVPYPELGRSLRLGHWGSAQSQGEHAARTILGARDPYNEVPYVFSDQYETGMEFWGDPALPGDILVRGELSARSFTAFWHQGGHVRAVLNMHVHHHEHPDKVPYPGHDHAEPKNPAELSASHGGEQANTTSAVPSTSGHGGAHVDPELVSRLLRHRSAVDLAALTDPDVPLAHLLRT